MVLVILFVLMAGFINELGMAHEVVRYVLMGVLNDVWV